MASTWALWCWFSKFLFISVEFIYVCIHFQLKRLLRFDNDAVNVKWEVLSEEEESGIKTEPSDGHGAHEKGEGTVKKEKTGRVKQEARAIKSEREQNTVNSELSTNVDVGMWHNFFLIFLDINVLRQLHVNRGSMYYIYYTRQSYAGQNFLANC